MFKSVMLEVSLYADVYKKSLKKVRFRSYRGLNEQEKDDDFLTGDRQIHKSV